HQLIVIGLIAHTCIEATVRYAAKLGYQVTVVKDATADYSDEMMHAALDIKLPNYAAIVTTKEVIASISSLSTHLARCTAGATASCLCLRCMSPQVARRVNSRQRSTSVAFAGAPHPSSDGRITLTLIPKPSPRRHGRRGSRPSARLDSRCSPAPRRHRAFRD